MKRLLIWVILIITLLVGLIAAIPYMFSSDQIWAKVNPLLEDQIGRKISVAGDRKLSLYPNIALVLGDVEIGSNISADTPLASLEKLRVSVDLMSLFSGNINIKELLLDGADISLIIGENGIANWQNTNDAPTPLPEQATTDNDPLGALIADSVNENDNPSNPSNSQTEFDISTLSIKNFKIINSRLTYEDHQAGSFELVENINLDIILAAQNKNLSLNGNATWQKQPIDFTVDSFDIAEFSKKQTSALRFKMNAAPLSMDLAGQLDTADKLKFNGKVAVKSNSIKQLANWVNTDLSTVNDTALDLLTELKVSGNSYQMGNLNLGVFNSKINGTLNFSNAAIPNIYGQLNIDQLNIGAIMPESETAASGSGWSQSPLNLGFLAQLNSNIKLAIGKLNYDGIDISALNSSLVIRKSTAQIPLQFSVFGGQINGDIAASSNGGNVSFNANIAAQDIKVGDALIKLDITDKLSATASLNTKLSAAGSSMQQLMSNLNGTGALVMADGVITGIAIADALAPEIANIDLSLNSPQKLAEFAVEASSNIYNQNVQSIISDGFGQNTGAEKQTKFVKATMNFNIQNGVLSNQDLEVNSENIVIRGEGTVDIGNRSLQYRIIPKLLRQTETGTAERMTIPAIITGPWSDPTVAIDYSYAIENSSTISNMRDKVVNKITEKITEKITDVLVEKVTEKLGEQIGEQLGGEITNQLGEQLGNILGVQPQNDDEVATELPDEQPKELPESTTETAPKTDAEKLLGAGSLLNNLLNNSN